jgi:Polyketide cyclase / dehydrase and lipid transport
MASVRTEFQIDVDAEQVWRVVGDWANGPVDMARGHVVSSEACGAVRVVTFARGTIARERLISRDEAARRIVYSLIGDTVCPEHDNAVMQILAGRAGRCRFIWSRDVLPDELAGPLHVAMTEAAPIIKRTLEYTGHHCGGAAPRPKPQVD